MTTPPTKTAARLAAALILMVGAAGGCDGGGKTKVTGKVSMGGKPVVWGSVTLADSTGMLHTGGINADGTYAIDGVPSGPVKIGVYSPKPEDNARAAMAGKGGMVGGKGGMMDDPREKFMAAQGKKAAEPDRPPPPPGAWFAIPDKFQDPQKSGLVGTVSSGQPLDIDLK